MQKEYNEFMNYLVDLVDDIGEIISQNKRTTYEEFLTSIAKVMFEPKHRIHLGVLVILISMLLYILDLL